MSGFHEPIRYDEDFEEDILIFMQNLIQESFEIISTQKSTITLNTAIIFIIDNASLMNEIDWKLYLQLAQLNDLRFKNLIIFLNLESQKYFIKPLSATTSSMGLEINKNA